MSRKKEKEKRAMPLAPHIATRFDDMQFYKTQCRSNQPDLHFFFFWHFKTNQVSNVLLLVCFFLFGLLMLDF